MSRLAWLFALIALAECPAAAQNAVLQSGPWSSFHIPAYSNPGQSQPTVSDFQSLGAAPTIATNACGSVTAGTVSGSDIAGQLTVGTSGVTSCAVTFGTVHQVPPSQCQLTSMNAIAAAWSTTGAYVSSLTTTGFTITGTALAGAAYGFFCL